MRTFIKFSFVLLLGSALVGQDAQSRPRFSDYPVDKVYRGKPAQPRLSKDQRTFRTMIRRDAKADVEFAGHYTISRWGCGTGCTGFAIVDSVTGRVYDGFYVSELPLAWLEKHKEKAIERMEFRPESRLLKINGCINEKNCGFYDYVVVEDKGLELVRKRLLPPEYQ